MRAHKLGDAPLIHPIRPERLDQHRNRIRDADRVRNLNLAAFGEPCREDVLGHVARAYAAARWTLVGALARARHANVTRHPARLVEFYDWGPETLNFARTRRSPIRCADVVAVYCHRVARFPVPP